MGTVPNPVAFSLGIAGRIRLDLAQAGLTAPDELWWKDDAPRMHGHTGPGTAEAERCPLFRG